MDESSVAAERLALHLEKGRLLARLDEIDIRRDELLRAPALASAGVDEADDAVVVHKGVEIGCRVMLDEDVYAESPAHVPPKVYVFDEFDSEAPADSNCTLVDAASGDWTVRGIGELVPVDDEDDEKEVDR